MFTKARRHIPLGRPAPWGLAVWVAVMVVLIGIESALAQPTVNGWFRGDGDDAVYQFLAESPGRGKVFYYLDTGTTPHQLYLLIQVDPAVNDNVFAGNPTPADDVAYQQDAGWNPPPHDFQALIRSEHLTLTVGVCGATYNWTLDYLYAKSKSSGQILNTPQLCVGGVPNTDIAWFADENGNDGGGTPPPGFISASSLQQNLQAGFDITYGCTRTALSTYKSPEKAGTPTEVPESYPGYDGTFQWEWPVIYEMRFDVPVECLDVTVEINEAHNSPPKSGDENVIIPPTPLPDTRVEIAKDADPDGDTQFDFTFDDGLISESFSLQDPGDVYPASRLFGSLQPGTYTFTESVPNGWALDEVVCTGQINSGINYLSNGVRIDLVYGEHVTCTFRDVQRVQAQGLISVVKDAQPNSPDIFGFNLSGDDYSQDFNLKDECETCPNQSTFSVNPGTYYIFEVPSEVWALVDVACQVNGGAPFHPAIIRNSVEVTVPADETVTCTFINRPRPTLEIVKDVYLIPPESPWDFNAAPPMGGAFQIPASGGSQMLRPYRPGTYTVEEFPKEPYTLAFISCDDRDEQFITDSNAVTVELDWGEHVTCTFKNVPPNYLFVPTLSQVGLGVFGLVIVLTAVYVLRRRRVKV